MDTEPPRPPGPPPGWFPDGRGDLRWWDGSQWTAHVAARPPDLTWATLSHLSMFVLSVFGALIIYLTRGPKDPFVRHHSSEALNAQIWLAIAWNLLLAPAILIGVISGAPPVWLFAVVPLAFLLWAVAAGFALHGTVQASRGIWWRYPLPFRFVRGCKPLSGS